MILAQSVNKPVKPPSGQRSFTGLGLGLAIAPALSNSFEPTIETKSFPWKKALYALQGRMVITDESSPFEWVGSDNAGPCIIAVVAGLDGSGKKVAACAHISHAESPYSIKILISTAGIVDVSDAYLVSGDTNEGEPFVLDCLGLLSREGVTPKTSLGKGVKEIAINVNTGEVVYQVAFTMANAGEKDVGCLDFYAMQAIYNFIADSPFRALVQIGVDGRLEDHVLRVQELLEVSNPPACLSKPTGLFDSTAFSPALEPMALEEEKTEVPQARDTHGSIHTLFFSSSSTMTKLHEAYLIDNRHQSPELQEAYDCKFGLVQR